MTSRFTVVTAPARSPGVCYITRTSIGPFIDSGIDMSVSVIDRGRLYLAVDVIREMAQVAGLFDEGKPVSVVMQEKQWYDRGYNEAIKELKSDAISNYVQRVFIDSSSIDGDAALVAPESDGELDSSNGSDYQLSGAGAHESLEVDDGLERESASIGGIERPVSLSTNPSDESKFRL
jgi:hypothetical protein